MCDLRHTQLLYFWVNSWSKIEKANAEVAKVRDPLGLESFRYLSNRNRRISKAEPPHKVLRTTELDVVSRRFPKVIQRVLSTLDFGDNKIRKFSCKDILIYQSRVQFKSETVVWFFTRKREAHSEQVNLSTLLYSPLKRLVNDKVFDRKIAVQSKVPFDEKLVWVSHS